MKINRRAILSGLAGAGLYGPTATLARAEPASARKSLRVAFLTDSHLPVSPGENQRMSKMLDRVLGQHDKPELVVFGGDNVMAVDDDDEKNTATLAQAQFDNWVNKVLHRLTCPSVSVIGNHDIFWNDSKGKPAVDPKARAIEAYRMPHRYFSYRAGGWRFLLLDTFHADGCLIDPEQFQWLERELSDGTEPIILVSHAPILSVTGFLESKVERPGGRYVLPSGWIVADVGKLKDLFLRHPRIKLALSGHMHQVDRVDYQGIEYLCGGAVSGNWWDPGKYVGFGPAYVMIDLFVDGSFRHEVIFWE
jgi:3',5'-cyclic-AMP phosphodiesterase